MTEADVPSAQKVTDKAIVELLPADGMTSAEIAIQLEADEAEVISVLYQNLGTMFHQDNHYRWYDRSHVKPKKHARREVGNDEFARICSYYLECINQTDSTGYSFFTQDKFNSPDYLEVSSLPSKGQSALMEGSVSSLQAKLRRARSRKELFFGYPINIKQMRSKKSGWTGYIAEPVFIFKVDIEDGNAWLAEELPIINSAVIKGHANASSESEFAAELAALEEELGLSAGAEPSAEDLALRLASIRSDWKWKGKINPALLDSRSLTELSEPGIYNKGAFFLAERSMFTQGLEAELGQLATHKNRELIPQTALASLLNETTNDDAQSAPQPVLEVLPMNLEQRNAVAKALDSQLTVVTGPPGTGKSQLITNLIINAIWQGQSVLFASKNNNAVDVVDMRVNAAAPKDVLIRTGSNAYQHRVAEYLLDAVQSTATELDREEYDYQKQEYDRVVQKVASLEQKQARLIDVRNLADSLDERYVELLNQEGQEYIDQVVTLNGEDLREYLSSLLEALSAIDPAKQGLLKKIVYAFKKQQLHSEYAELLKQSEGYCIGLDGTKSEIEQGYDAMQIGESVLDDLEQIAEYKDAISELEQSETFEDIAAEQYALQQEVVKISAKLWGLYVKLAPDRLKPENRSMINKYKAILQMIHPDTDIYNELGKDVYSQYKKICQSAVQYLPAWAVTALSARGKIPFEAGMFDLVIFDEASQCDIASALPLLFRAKRAVVIGDPKQLNHVTTLSSKNDQMLMKRYGLLTENPEWSFSINSLFDLAQGKVQTEDIVNLRDHHRSHKDIIDFSNTYFYGGNLRVATKYDRLVKPLGKMGVRWQETHGTTASRPKGGSWINEKEAAVVVRYLDGLVSRGYTGSIGVVAPFRAQANRIHELVSAEPMLEQKLSSMNFAVDTIHRFQGDERDLIIFSPTVANGALEGAQSFMRNGANLFNVALTRARSQFIVIGDMKYALQCDVPFLKKFAEYALSLNEGNSQDSVSQKYSDNPYSLLPASAIYSEWEVRLFEALKLAGIRAIPQYSIDSYDLDLAIIDGDRRLDVEVDGERYHREWTGELCRRDQIRNQRMYELGWDVMRFWVYEVRDNIDDCVKSIQEWLDSGEGGHIVADGSNQEQDVISEPEPIQPKPEYTTLEDDEEIGEYIEESREQDEVIGGYEFDDADEADEEIDEGIAEYLRKHIQGYISIRYQSKRANSARRWRELKLIDFDDTFIYTEDTESERLIRYRRDGIVEHK